MSSPRNLICLKCKHFNYFGTGCKAFPEGIPDEIIIKNKHSIPLPIQTNNVIFEEQKDEENYLI